MGDTLHSIDAIPVYGKTAEEVTRSLLGARGTPVLLALQRPAWDGMSAKWNTVGQNQTRLPHPPLFLFLSLSVTTMYAMSAVICRLFPPCTQDLDWRAPTIPRQNSEIPAAQVMLNRAPLVNDTHASLSMSASSNGMDSRRPAVGYR